MEKSLGLQHSYLARLCEWSQQNKVLSAMRSDEKLIIESNCGSGSVWVRRTQFHRRVVAVRWRLHQQVTTRRTICGACSMARADIRGSTRSITTVVADWSWGITPFEIFFSKSFWMLYTKQRSRVMLGLQIDIAPALWKYLTGRRVMISTFLVLSSTQWQRSGKATWSEEVLALLPTQKGSVDVRITQTKLAIEQASSCLCFLRRRVGSEEMQTNSL